MDTAGQAKGGVKRAALLFAVLLAASVGCQLLGHALLTGFDTIDVSTVWIQSDNGLMVFGKLFAPKGVGIDKPAPAVLYLHGYQNTKETSEPYALELARRGIVTLAIDTLGRGRSDSQFSLDEPGFDPTYGGLSSFRYLRGLPIVDPSRCGIAGHSLGGEMAYAIALKEEGVAALAFSGFAYDARASADRPRNMLMIYGAYDEYRKRMTGTRRFEAEWMKSPQTKAAFAVPAPEFDATYGSFADGSARQVYLAETTHVGQSFNRASVARAVSWFCEAFGLPASPAPTAQLWQLKELCAFLSMLAAFASVLPLAFTLLSARPFRALSGKPGTTYVCEPRDFRRSVAASGLLSLTFLPCVLILFAFHIYVTPIDSAFPMMMVNGVAFWFLVINSAGYARFRSWFRNASESRPEITYAELGLSAREPGAGATLRHAALAAAFAIVLFAYLYAVQLIMERSLLVNFRYVFPFAGELTPYRVLMFILYFPLFLLGYLQFNILLQAQLRPRIGRTWLRTAFAVSARNIAIVIAPLALILAVQYVPLFINGFIPFVGPGSALVGFVINIAQMCVVLAIMIPVATFMYYGTGTIYVGAILNALIVAWMFTSTSVIAPLPI